MSPNELFFVIPSLQGGGSERVIVTLLKHLDRKKFRLFLLVVNMQGARYRHQIPDDVCVVDLACSRVLTAVPNIVRLLWIYKPKAIFSTLGHLNLALSIVRPFFPRKVALIARESSVVSEVLKGYFAPGLWRILCKIFYRRIDLVICQSRSMLDDLVVNFYLPYRKSIVISNPLEIDRIRDIAKLPAPGADVAWVDGTVRLITAGRLSSEKGFDLLIDALSQCNDLPLSLVIMGDGPMLGKLIQQTIDLNLEDRIRFVGFQENPYAWFSRGDIFVLSSRFEGFPNVLIEALACGKPVVATPAIGGTREILDAVVECEMAEDVSSIALASAIRRMVARFPIFVPDPVVLPYDVNNIVQRYEAAIEGAIESYSFR